MRVRPVAPTWSRDRHSRFSDPTQHLVARLRPGQAGAASERDPGTALDLLDPAALEGLVETLIGGIRHGDILRRRGRAEKRRSDRAGK